MTQDLTANYKQAYDQRLGGGERPALILVDFVQAYFDQRCPLYADVDAALAAALRVREAARCAKIPVIYTHVVYHDNGADGRCFLPESACD